MSIYYVRMNVGAYVLASSPEEAQRTLRHLGRELDGCDVAADAEEVTALHNVETPWRESLPFTLDRSAPERTVAQWLTK